MKHEPSFASRNRKKNSQSLGGSGLRKYESDKSCLCMYCESFCKGNLLGFGMKYSSSQRQWIICTKKHRKYLYALLLFVSVYESRRTGKKFSQAHLDPRTLEMGFHGSENAGNAKRYAKWSQTFFNCQRCPFACRALLCWRMLTTIAWSFSDRIALPDYVDARIEALQPIIGYRKRKLEQLFSANHRKHLNLRCAIETPLNLLNLICCDSKTPKKMEMKALSQRSSIKMQCCQLS